MSTEFSNKISMKRKEKNISQKQAAIDLGISQALLSHYEKGIRECGLSFLVKIADYYNVSCDYLLGRTSDPGGKIVTVGNIPTICCHSEETTEEERENCLEFCRQIINDSINVIYSMIKKTKSRTLTSATGAYLGFAVYKVFRTIYNANPKNDKSLFALDDTFVSDMGSSVMAESLAGIRAAVSGVELEGNDIVENKDDIVVDKDMLYSEDSPYGLSLISLIKCCEERVKNPKLKCGHKRD